MGVVGRWLCWLVGWLVGLVGLVGLVCLVGLVRPIRPVGLLVVSYVDVEVAEETNLVAEIKNSHGYK